MWLVNYVMLTQKNIVCLTKARTKGDKHKGPINGQEARGFDKNGQVVGPNSSKSNKFLGNLAHHSNMLPATTSDGRFIANGCKVMSGII